MRAADVRGNELLSQGLNGCSVVYDVGGEGKAG